ncbi:MAG: RdgB/HAM1 family non-canonical purine NTP pyrophosphatase [Gemmataceae bacterium]|nr:RdgB/HAM1 family non-canonical purine NTP pyrophosphatase [Gemmataceae bacterium]
MLLVLATRNRKKREEIVAILSDLGLLFGDLSDWPNLPEVEETGTTFEENARLKAIAVARGTGHWALGEDSGLVVPALGGAPGVYSARYAGRQGDDEANNAKLLAELAKRPDADRSAYYVCTAALADPTGHVHVVTEGRCHGRILDAPRGSGGFGYDPLFLIPEYHRTFAELSPRVKHALSHRARALERLRPWLRRLVQSNSRMGVPSDSGVGRPSAET